jgi:hypothetical protein
VSLAALPVVGISRICPRAAGILSVAACRLVVAGMEDPAIRAILPQKYI